jgi:hypothetical protein
LIGSRYERRSMLITANQPFGEWGKVFPDELCRKVGDGLSIAQAAARFCFTSMPSANLTPVMTFGN